MPREDLKQRRVNEAVRFCRLDGNLPDARHRVMPAKQFGRRLASRLPLNAKMAFLKVLAGSGLCAEGPSLPLPWYDGCIAARSECFAPLSLFVELGGCATPKSRNDEDVSCWVI